MKVRTDEILSVKSVVREMRGHWNVAPKNPAEIVEAAARCGAVRGEGTGHNKTATIRTRRDMLLTPGLPMVSGPFDD